MRAHESVANVKVLPMPMTSSNEESRNETDEDISNLE